MILSECELRLHLTNGWARMGWCKHIPTRFVVALLLSETAVSLPMIFLCMVMYGNVQEYAIMQFYSMCIINIIYIYVCVHLVTYFASHTCSEQRFLSSLLGMTPFTPRVLRKHWAKSLDPAHELSLTARSDKSCVKMCRRNKSEERMSRN